MCTCALVAGVCLLLQTIAFLSFVGGAIEREDVPASELEEGDEVIVGNKRCQLVSKHHEVMDEKITVLKARPPSGGLRSAGSYRHKRRPTFYPWRVRRLTPP